MRNEKLLVLNNDDNIGILLENAIKNEKIEGEAINVTLKEDIPFGFKVAIKDIQEGELVYKYGHEIGKAIRKIEHGEMVHVHNIKGLM